MKTSTQEITNSMDFIGRVVTVKLDRPLNSKHPKYNWEYKLNYGFVPDSMSPDGEELDAYVVGVNEPIDTFIGTCIAVIRRLNDNDDKLIVVSDDKKDMSDEEIVSVTHFQEQFFKSKVVR